MTDGNFNFNTQPTSPDEGDGAQMASPIPELPLPRQRWTVRRKPAVVEAVRGGWVPVEEVSRLYDLSADEILAWERDLDRYGVPGLRSTRLQIYRNTDNANRGDPPARSLADAVSRRNALPPTGITAPSKRCRGTQSAVERTRRSVLACARSSCSRYQSPSVLLHARSPTTRDPSRAMSFPQGL